MWPLAALLLVTGWITWNHSPRSLKPQQHRHQRATCTSTSFPLKSQEQNDENYSLYVDVSGDSWEPFLESGGFCNHLYKNRRSPHPYKRKNESKKILKVYSDLALKRMELSGNKRSQELMGNLGIGPAIFNSTGKYMIMEELEGQVLTQDVLFSSTPGSTKVMQSVATTLAKLHSTPYVSINKNSSNMLWSCCDVLISQLRLNDDGLYRYYKKELEKQQRTLDALQLPLVLGHGDFKPSNVIILDGSGEAKLVDWETCGCHFRAYDVAKLFRMTSTTITEKEKDQATTNRFAFLQLYCNVVGNDTCSPTLLWLESKLLLPMTWLEAALFFHCKSSSGEKEYLSLAENRLEGYQESLSDWQHHLMEYQAQVENPLR
jgi:thiamine kinase-like enzyme